MSSESPQKKSRAEGYPGEDPYARYPQHYGQPMPPPYGNHHLPPPGPPGAHHGHAPPPSHYGYPPHHAHHGHHPPPPGVHHGHAPPPPHYAQSMYGHGAPHGGPPPGHPSHHAPPPSSHHGGPPLHHGYGAHGSPPSHHGPPPPPPPPPPHHHHHQGNPPQQQPWGGPPPPASSSSHFPPQALSVETPSRRSVGVGGGRDEEMNPGPSSSPSARRGENFKNGTSIDDEIIPIDVNNKEQRIDDRANDNNNNDPLAVTPSSAQQQQQQQQQQTNGMNSRNHQTSSSTTESSNNNDNRRENASPTRSAAWHPTPNSWHGSSNGPASATPSYVMHPPSAAHGPPPPHMYGGGGGASPPNWRTPRPPSGPPQSSPTQQRTMLCSPADSARHNKRKEELAKERERGRGSYRCGRCGAPKKGHVCPYQPKLKRRPGEPLPVMKSASTQVEMDEFLVVRRLNLEIQGFPETYTTEPMGDVGTEVHPSSSSPPLMPPPQPSPPPAVVANSPHHHHHHQQSSSSPMEGHDPLQPADMTTEARLQEIEQSIHETISADLMNVSYTSKDSHDLKTTDRTLAEVEM